MVLGNVHPLILVILPSLYILGSVVSLMQFQVLLTLLVQVSCVLLGDLVI